MFGYESWCSDVFGWGPGWCSSGWWAACLVVMMLIMILCFIFIIFMMRRRKGNLTCCSPPVRKNEGTAYPASDSAGAILDKRYVAGEISANEYEEKKSDLNPT
jgi:uncharacterized membrane protein